jgi:hypothetical protein
VVPKIIVLVDVGWTMDVNCSNDIVLYLSNPGIDLYLLNTRSLPLKNELSNSYSLHSEKSNIGLFSQILFGVN